LQNAVDKIKSQFSLLQLGILLRIEMSHHGSSLHLHAVLCHFNPLNYFDILKSKKRFFFYKNDCPYFFCHMCQLVGFCLPAVILPINYIIYEIPAL